MFAHFGALFPSGFLGVDIFFAISGFVITLSFLSLLKRSANVKAVLVEFWRRRFWRLVPALSVVLSATLVVALFLLPPREFRDQVYMTIWSFFFAGNAGVEIVSRADYFDPGGEENWLLHLWSLGVEEQFYLVFPFLFLALVGIGQRSIRINRIVAVVGIFSFISLMFASVDDLIYFLGFQNAYSELGAVTSILGYYSPLTRAWQFGIGIIAALLAVQKARTSRPLISLMGVILLVGSFIVMPQSNLLPGPLTLFPMAAMFILLLWPLGDNATLGRALRPLVWLGDRSYVAYLWHWPIWSALVVIFPDRGAGLIGAAFLMTLILADASHRLIERPIIESRRRSLQNAEAPGPTPSRPHLGKPVSLATAISFPIVLGILILTAQHQLEQSGVLTPAVEIPRLDESKNCLEVSCLDKDIDVLLIGDSHAGALSGALEKELNVLGLNMFTAVTQGCMHLLSETIVSTEELCRQRSQQTRELIKNNPPRIVVSFGYTAGRFTTINSGKEQQIALMFAQTGERVSPKEAPEAYTTTMTETARTILGSGSRMVIVTGTPDFAATPGQLRRENTVVSQFDNLFAKFIEVQVGETVSWSDYLNRHGEFRDTDFRIADSSSGIEVADPWDWVCEPDRCNQITRDREFIFSDTDHLSQFGADRLAEGIIKGNTGWFSRNSGAVF